jgi:hypothetical protein
VILTGRSALVVGVVAIDSWIVIFAPAKTGGKLGRPVRK